MEPGFLNRRRPEKQSSRTAAPAQPEKKAVDPSVDTSQKIQNIKFLIDSLRNIANDISQEHVNARLPIVNQIINLISQQPTTHSELAKLADLFSKPANLFDQNNYFANLLFQEVLSEYLMNNNNSEQNLHNFLTHFSENQDKSELFIIGISYLSSIYQASDNMLRKLQLFVQPYLKNSTHKQPILSRIIILMLRRDINESKLTEFIKSAEEDPKVDILEKVITSTINIISQDSTQSDLIDTNLTSILNTFNKINPNAFNNIYYQTLAKLKATPLTKTFNTLNNLLNPLLREIDSLISQKFLKSTQKSLTKTLEKIISSLQNDQLSSTVKTGLQQAYAKGFAHLAKNLNEQNFKNVITQMGNKLPKDENLLLELSSSIIYQLFKENVTEGIGFFLAYLQASGKKYLAISSLGVALRYLLEDESIGNTIVDYFLSLLNSIATEILDDKNAIAEITGLTLHSLIFFHKNDANFKTVIKPLLNYIKTQTDCNSIIHIFLFNISSYLNQYASTPGQTVAAKIANDRLIYMCKTLKFKIDQSNYNTILNKFSTGAAKVDFENFIIYIKPTNTGQPLAVDTGSTNLLKTPVAPEPNTSNSSGRK